MVKIRDATQAKVRGRKDKGRNCNDAGISDPELRSPGSEVGSEQSIGVDSQDRSTSGTGVNPTGLKNPGKIYARLIREKREYIDELRDRVSRAQSRIDKYRRQIEVAERDLAELEQESTDLITVESESESESVE